MLRASFSPKIKKKKTIHKKRLVIEVVQLSSRHPRDETQAVGWRPVRFILMFGRLFSQTSFHSEQWFSLLLIAGFETHVHLQRRQTSIIVRLKPAVKSWIQIRSTLHPLCSDLKKKIKHVTMFSSSMALWYFVADTHKTRLDHFTKLDQFYQHCEHCWFCSKAKYPLH